MVTTTIITTTITVAEAPKQQDANQRHLEAQKTTIHNQEAMNRNESEKERNLLLSMSTITFLIGEETFPKKRSHFCRKIFGTRSSSVTRLFRYEAKTALH